MSFFNWLFGRRRRIEPLFAKSDPGGEASARHATQMQQIQQIKDVSARLDIAEAELNQAQVGLRTMNKDIIKDDHHGA